MHLLGLRRDLRRSFLEQRENVGERAERRSDDAPPVDAGMASCDVLGGDGANEPVKVGRQARVATTRRRALHDGQPPSLLGREHGLVARHGDRRAQRIDRRAPSCSTETLPTSTSAATIPSTGVSAVKTAFTQCWLLIPRT
jgi:hypothetical protein